MQKRKFVPLKLIFLKKRKIRIEILICGTKISTLELE